MVFSRLFFIYLFFPICFLCYFATKKTSYRNAVLIVFSLLFYACGDISFLWLVVASALVNFVLGRGIDKFRDKAPAKAFLALGLVLNLGTLVGFKYTGFFIENLNNWFSLSIPVPDLPLPLGISFFTFRTVSYLIDCAWGKVKAERNFFTFLLYVSFFPITISGPIGFGRIAVGLGKKVILADRLSGIVDQFLGNDFTTQTTLGVWYGVILYALQMYFDFSGYSDMAIGIARIFGFHLDENFRHPFLCKDITEFWQRWHISLGTFFRDYLLYVPLFGKRRKIGGLLLVWFCTGLWHGASWNFVVWGLFHGVFLVLERMLPIEKFLRFRLIQNIYALLVVMVGWVFFRAENLTAALDYLKRMFVPYKTDVYSAYLSNEFMMVAALGLVSCGFLTLIFDKLPVKTEYKFGFLRLVNPAWCAVIAYFSVLLLASNTYNPFIYFRF